MSESKPAEQFAVGVAVEFDEPAAEAGLLAALEIIGAQDVQVEPVPLDDVDAVVVVAVDAISASSARAQVDVALEVSDATVHGPLLVEPAAAGQSSARIIADLLDEFPAV